MASPLINLCDPIFKSVISCDTVSSEGYEVTNLLSGDSEKRKCGFLGDRFIKPPVEVTLKFPFDVNIRHIQIWAEVGQQKSSGLEIHSSSAPYNSSLCSGSSSKSQPLSSFAYSPITERIFSVVLNDSEKGVIVYCPLQYGRLNPNPVLSSKANVIQRPMVWKKRSVIAHTSSLTFRIFRTNGSSVPALGGIEVWGGPSSCMSSSKVADILTLWNNTHMKEESEVDDIPKDVISPPPKKKLDELLLPDIPEEFLDAITWEIMALPMVLPSGKVVDQQTLDLHAQAEANWGRHPSDPFTGLLFSDGCRPILDCALKARIDRFLLLNQDRKDLKAVPRTVGRSQSQTHQTVSRFRSNRVCFDSAVSNRKRAALGSSPMHGSLTFLQVGSGAVDPIQDRINSLPGCSGYQKTVETASDSSSCRETKRLKKADDGSSCGTMGKGQSSLTDCITIEDDDSQKIFDNVKSHEKKLDDSLDFALKAALSRLPSFVNPPQVLVKECGSCKASARLYNLPCNHFLCRLCLVEKNKEKPSKCSNCGTEFKSSDPVAHHE